ncbi:MAG: OsmC family protein [Caldilineaceae bacterium]|nr:OsmC family protein [Caldilineaceae bacterium]
MYRRISMAIAGVLLIILLAASAVIGKGNVQQADPTPTPMAEEEGESEMQEAMLEEEEDVQLVTAKVSADLVRPGRVLMSARGNHWIYDSVPPLNGPNEEVNPLDGLLAALGACGMYIYEAVGREQHIPVNHLSSTVTGELDGRGVAGAAVSPRLRAFHVRMVVEGPNAEQAAMMADEFSRRCPIYTTLAPSAPIHVTNVVMGVAQEAISTEADPIVDYDEMDELEPELGKPSASGVMFGFGRSVMSARGNHWIFDSVPPIHGPNEEVNPLDAFAGALPACGIMVYEAAAKENDIALHSIRADVEADLDPRGVAGADVNPRIRAFRVTMHVDGPTAEEAEMLADEFSRRCPIYTTFERSAPIEVVNEVAQE